MMRQSGIFCMKRALRQ